jgi:hypothetical protein
MVSHLHYSCLVTEREIRVHHMCGFTELLIVNVTILYRCYGLFFFNYYKLLSTAC